MAEEHLHWLHVIFDQCTEYNLKLKPSKCNFFKEEITYLVCQVSKDGVQSSNLNLKAIAECALPQIYTEVHAFLGLVGHYQKFIKGFACIAQPPNNHLTGEGVRRKSKHVLLSEDNPKGFQSPETGMHDSPCVGLCRLYQTLSARNRCIQGWTWGSAVPETG